MDTKKKLSEWSWGWISGVALGIGASVGVAFHSWILFFAISIIITSWMVWRALR